MSNEDSIKPGLAFGIVTASGLCTALGSTVVLFPSLVRFANRKALASGLAFAAGVMVYVSLVDMFPKSVNNFMDAEFLEHQAYLSATLCFFAGIVLLLVSDRML